MSARELTIEEFEENLQQSDAIVVVDWWAPWCMPCRVFSPIYDRVAGDHPDVVFGKVNTQDEQELAAAFEIRAIPTLSIFRDGVLVYHQAGMVPEQGLQDLVKQVKELDMEQVRASMQDAPAPRAAQG